jgi:hypothetical protein
VKRNTNGPEPTRNIHCTIVESRMNQVYRGKLDTAFQDFIPWADPYITSLVEKVRNSQGRLLDEAKDDRRDPEKD